MAKPDAIQWLEGQTGEKIPYEPERPQSAVRERHLSVRLDRETAVSLEALAAERRVTVSQLVRDLLRDAVELRQSAASLDASALADRLAADVAEVRRRLAG
jgi:predicted transcriptional regulator